MLRLSRSWFVRPPSWRRTCGSKSRWWCRPSPDRSLSARRQARGSLRSLARRLYPSRTASAFRGWRTAPGSREWQSPSGWRGGSSAWSARPDRRNCRTAHSFGRLLQRRQRPVFEKFLAQLAQQAKLGLEVDIVGQLQVLDKARRLHIVGMRHHELFVLRGRNNLLAKLAGAQRAIDQRHRHGLALALAEGEAIAPSKARRLARRTLKLVHHLALGERDRSQRHGEACIFGKELDLDVAKTDFSGEGMVAAITALRRIAERQQKPLVGAREILQPQVAVCRKAQGLAREIAHGRLGLPLRRRLDQAVAAENVGDPRGRSLRGLCFPWPIRNKALGEPPVQKAMGVVEGGPQDL